MTLEVYKLVASQLATLLQILGALTVDFVESPQQPMDKALYPFVKTPLAWRDLPTLSNAIHTAMGGGDKRQALFDLGTDIKKAFPQFKRNLEYSNIELKLLKAFGAYFASESASAMNFIIKNASTLGPDLAKIFAPSVNHMDASGLKKVVKSLVGRDGVHITQEEAALAKETNPEVYQKYLDLRKAHTADFKESLAAYIRNTGKRLVPYAEVYKAMTMQGFTHSMVPGFTGLVDDLGRWYDKEGKLLSGTPNLNTYTHVMMNDGTDPEAQWYFKAVKPDGGVAYGYTAEYRKSQSLQKYANVAELMEKIDSIRKNWLRHVVKFDVTNKLSVSAVVLEILYSFAARVGSAPGRGVGTLLVKNSSVTGQGVNLAYLGKDSIPTKHIIKSTTSPAAAAVVKALLKLRDGKTPSSFLFTIEPKEGKFVRVSPQDINKAFRSFGAPAELTVHKLRTLRGTSLFLELMQEDEKRRPPGSEKEALDRYKKMTEKVGELLNHKRGVGTDKESVTGTTAALNYIDASVQLDLFARWGVRPPIGLEKLLKAGDDL